MGFYFAEVRKLRRELQAAYGAGEYKKALILGKNILQKYMENDDANTMEYASDMHNLGYVPKGGGVLQKSGSAETGLFRRKPFLCGYGE